LKSWLHKTSNQLGLINNSQSTSWYLFLLRNTLACLLITVKLLNYHSMLIFVLEYCSTHWFFRYFHSWVRTHKVLKNWPHLNIFGMTREKKKERERKKKRKKERKRIYGCCQCGHVQTWLRRMFFFFNIFGTDRQTDETRRVRVRRQSKTRTNLFSELWSYCF
jgi:hypothetical protein